jgi:outer membrane protein assembly factor BamB
VLICNGGVIMVSLLLLLQCLLLLVAARIRVSGAQLASCVQEMAALCGEIRAIDPLNCLRCCGQNQHQLKTAGCSNADTHAFCDAAASFQFGAPHVVHSQPGPVHASPVILNDTVLFSTLEPDCAFYRLNVSTGKVVWRFAGPHRDSADPASSRCGLRATARVSRTPTGAHHIHIGSDNNSFIALDAASGDVVWSNMERSATCVDSGTRFRDGRPCEVYSTALVLPRSGLLLEKGRRDVRIQGSEDGIIRAFDAATGDHIWSKTVGEEANGSPVANPANNSQVVIATDDGFLYCLSVETGEECGQPLATCGGMDTMPSVDPVENVLFYTCYYPPDPNSLADHPRGWVAAVDMRTFAHLWLNNGTGGIPFYSPAHRALFVGYMDGHVEALNCSNGRTLWVLDNIPGAKGEFFGSFIWDNLRDLLYGVNLKGTAVAISPHTGRLVSSVHVASTVANVLGPALSNDYGTLYVGAYSGSQGGKLIELALPRIIPKY